MKKETKKLISDKEFASQLKRAEKQKSYEPRALSVNHENGETSVQFDTAWSFSFNPRSFPELANASEDELANVRLLGVGNTIEWTSLDAHIGVGAIILELLGEKFVKSEIARINGSKTSERKAAAVRANGALGGRPRKETAEAKKKIIT